MTQKQKINQNGSRSLSYRWREGVSCVRTISRQRWGTVPAVPTVVRGADFPGSSSEFVAQPGCGLWTRILRQETPVFTLHSRPFQSRRQIQMGIHTNPDLQPIFNSKSLHQAALKVDPEPAIHSIVGPSFSVSNNEVFADSNPIPTYPTAGSISSIFSHGECLKRLGYQKVNPVIISKYLNTIADNI